MKKNRGWLLLLLVLPVNAMELNTNAQTIAVVRRALEDFKVADAQQIPIFKGGLHLGQFGAACDTQKRLISVDDTMAPTYITYNTYVQAALMAMNADRRALIADKVIAAAGLWYAADFTWQAMDIVEPYVSRSAVSAVMVAYGGLAIAALCKGLPPVERSMRWWIYMKATERAVRMLMRNGQWLPLTTVLCSFKLQSRQPEADPIAKSRYKGIADYLKAHGCKIQHEGTSTMNCAILTHTDGQASFAVVRRDPI